MLIDGAVKKSGKKEREKEQGGSRSTAVSIVTSPSCH